MSGADDPFADLPRGQFKVIYTDPPWSFQLYSQAGEAKSAHRHYTCVDIDEMAEWDVESLAAPDAVMVMWATQAMLPEAIWLMNRWGFTLKSVGAWAKRSKRDRTWAFGTGFLYRSAAEFFLLGTRGKPQSRSKSIRNLIVAPVREHSRKPDQMYLDIEAQWDGPFLEMFARTNPRPGWTAWGNEVGAINEEGRQVPDAVSGRPRSAQTVAVKNGIDPEGGIEDTPKPVRSRSKADLRRTPEAAEAPD